MAMEHLQILGAKIAGFPGYADEDARRRSDELVRSYLGEALATLADRLRPLDGTVETRLGDLVMRSAFTNQEAYESYEERARESPGFDAMAAADVRTIEAADAAPSVEAAGMAAYLDRVSQVLDARDAVMEGGVSCT